MQTFENIVSSIRKKEFRPVYLLMGEETYFIDFITELLEEHVLEEEFKAFNLISVYGRDTDFGTIANYIRSYPMCGKYQLLIVKEAQELKEIEKLDSYIAAMPESTIIVFNYKYKKLKGSTSFVKNIDKKGVVFEAKKLYENTIPNWINKYLQQKNYNITPKACKIIADYLGNDLHKVRNELEKLMITLPQSKTITEDDVETNIGISKEFNAFELQSALANRNILKANRIAFYFAANSKDNPAVKTLSIIHGFFIKILKYHYAPDKSPNAVASLLGVHPFFISDYQIGAANFSVPKIADVISIIHAYDLKAKGFGSNSISDGDLYKELIYKILH